MYKTLHLFYTSVSLQLYYIFYQFKIQKRQYNKNTSEFKRKAWKETEPEYNQSNIIIESESRLIILTLIYYVHNQSYRSSCNYL